MPTDEKILSYTAGLFDGEGHVTIGKNPVVVRVGVTNTDIRVMDYLKKHFGGHYGSWQPKESNRKLRFDWEVQSKTASAFLTAISPFLLIKRDRADLAVAIQRTKVHGRKGTPQSVRDERARLSENITFLNKRGVA